MKRQARGSEPGGEPADAFDVMGQGVAGPTSYASASEDTLGGVELLEDRTARIAAGGHGRRVGMSVPSAVAGSLLVVALAFGAAMGPLAGEPTSDSAGDGKTAVTEPTAKPDGAASEPDKTAGPTEPDKTVSEATEPDKTAGPTEPDKTAAPAATEKPAPTKNPAPEPSAMEIGLALEGNAVVIEWSRCETDDFADYKVIRSKDEFATWPLGAGDSLAAAIEDQGTTRFVDKAVDLGRTYHYKVVGLRAWEGEKVVACRSGVKAIATPAPTPKPQPTDGGGATMSIAVSIKEGHPLIDWTACTGVDFDYYKVVRSTDSTVTWPPSGDDSKVAAVGVDGDTKAWDSSAPGGKKLYYRVFCIQETKSGSVAVAATAVKGIETPPAEPAPDPVALGFEIDVTGEGADLHWEGCSSDLFVFYKVVRSFTNPNPSYLPGADGTQVIGVIENAGTTQLTDEDVASGQTIYYRVQAIGYWNGSKILLGQTAVIAVTIP